ncbi:MAG: amino acid ABC transporter substrate-binding protein, partial [Firmicutes bacterium HGW-Firmicutes-6]
EAAMVLFNAMEESNSNNPDTIKKTIIKKGTYQGLQSEININEYGDATRTIYQYIVKDGQFKKAE